mmetsp:Transcript_11010/g.30907  ORF Transcript_11010/g.30907 Transcript_11010/m.30907 type:complete len:280 (+) Transcript_11010:466-1305(+)
MLGPSRLCPLHHETGIPGLCVPPRGADADRRHLPPRLRHFGQRRQRVRPTVLPRLSPLPAEARCRLSHPHARRPHLQRQRRHALSDTADREAVRPPGRAVARQAPSRIADGVAPVLGRVQSSPRAGPRRAGRECGVGHQPIFDRSDIPRGGECGHSAFAIDDRAGGTASDEQRRWWRWIVGRRCSCAILVGWWCQPSSASFGALQRDQCWQWCDTDRAVGFVVATSNPQGQASEEAAQRYRSADDDGGGGEAGRTRPAALRCAGGRRIRVQPRAGKEGH